MIFFPFIENALKHTENKKNENSIRIKFTVEQNRIIFECENSYQPNSSEKTDFGGIGNDLIEKRLMLIYPGKHLLKITDEGNVYQVSLTLETA